jgi:hypothetical protein
MTALKKGSREKTGTVGWASQSLLEKAKPQRSCGIFGIAVFMSNHLTTAYGRVMISVGLYEAVTTSIMVVRAAAKVVVEPL